MHKQSTEEDKIINIQGTFNTKDSISSKQYISHD